LCSDEIHSGLILDEQETPHVSALSFESPIRDRTIILMAVSKTFNVPGLACAFGIVPNAALRRRFIKAAGKLLSEINPFGYIATEAALSQGEPWRQELVTYLRRNRDRITQVLQQRIPHIKMTPLEATYLAWLDVRQLNHPHPTALFEQHGVGLSDGASYGAPGFVRMNFGCPIAKLELALTRLEAAVHSCVMRS
jgi:cystathionine beta-lyase